MTTEQAIKLLHRLQDEQFDGEYGDERREALSMAVRALSGDWDMVYRQQAIDAVRKLQKWNVMRENYKNEGFSYDDVMFTLEKLPSAQPERKKGRWKPLYDNIWICTNCEQTEQFGVNIESTSDYCPNCGADMRGESDE